MKTDYLWRIVELTVEFLLSAAESDVMILSKLWREDKVILRLSTEVFDSGGEANTFLDTQFHTN